MVSDATATAGADAADTASASQAATAGDETPVTGRTRHYGEFYGVATERPDDDRPVLVVHGNCQAEALRVVLDESRTSYRCVRVPPVHELSGADLGHLHRLLETCAVVVSQPVRPGYRGLPLGTTQLALAAPAARLVVVPIVRDARLHPYQALVRLAGAGEPPVVPYHDLRTLSRAAGRPPGPGAASPEGIAAVARRSQDELRRREVQHGTLVASDLLEQAGAASSHTLNHPGNPVLVGLAQRVLDALGDGATAVDPGRVLLRSVMSPLHVEVLEVLGLDPAAARVGWTVDGEAVQEEHVVQEQLRWYADHGDVVAAGLERHAAAMAALGL